MEHTSRPQTYVAEFFVYLLRKLMVYKTKTYIKIDYYNIQK